MFSGSSSPTGYLKNFSQLLPHHRSSTLPYRQFPARQAYNSIQLKGYLKADIVSFQVAFPTFLTTAARMLARPTRPRIAQRHAAQSACRIGQIRPARQVTEGVLRHIKRTFAPHRFYPSIFRPAALRVVLAAHLSKSEGIAVFLPFAQIDCVAARAGAPPTVRHRAAEIAYRAGVAGEGL